MTPKEALKEVLKIGKEKEVDVHMVFVCNTVNEHNKWTDKDKLTESEFTLLKGYLR